MTDNKATELAYQLIDWAKKCWGVETERTWRCPNYATDYGQSDYESYCSSCGRKMKQVTVESDTQTWRINLEQFLYNPEYPEPTKGSGGA